MIYSNIKVNRLILLADLGSDSEEIYIRIIILLKAYNKELCTAHFLSPCDLIDTL